MPYFVKRKVTNFEKPKPSPKMREVMKMSTKSTMVV
jgi:hypothetical protein